MIGRTTPLQIIFVIFIIYHHGEIYLIKKLLKNMSTKKNINTCFTRKNFSMVFLQQLNIML
ncbi:hypothetical protein AV889_21490 [Escherichia coli]|nr:hypothetical protein AAY45_21235 [Escherichia coli O157:H7]OJF20691.1 hypothetical protein AUR51_21620 [Escherichia coli]OJF24226.1 hypothetical protein AV889_21490 [Escherichia coli]